MRGDCSRWRRGEVALPSLQRLGGDAALHQVVKQAGVITTCPVEGLRAHDHEVLRGGVFKLRQRRFADSLQQAIKRLWVAVLRIG